MMKRLRNYFITGMVILVPLAVTMYVVVTVFNFMDSWLRDWVKVDGRVIPGLGLLLLLTITVIVGFLAHNYVGKKIISLSEDVLARIPMVNKFYSAVRQISQTILSRDKKIFQEVVAIQYPSKGIWSIGFVTSATGGEIDRVTGETMVMVFVCTVPTPTTGFVVAVPRREAITLKMSIEEAVSFILSAGVAVPGQSNQIPADTLKPFIHAEPLEKL